MPNPSRLFGLIVGLLLCGGCSSEPKSYRVTGNVTFEGQPVTQGDIHFIATDGRWGAEAGKIKDGRYELMAKAGTKRVEITASRARPGGAGGAGGEPVPEEYSPDEYNVKSKLTAEVAENGKNEFDFRLKGPKK
jgi:hypothetical protein